MKRRVLLSVTAVLSCLFAGVLWAQQIGGPGRDAPRLKGPEPFTRETPAPPMQQQVTDDVRRRRNYPDQPPLIPHSIEGYALDLNANKCLACHSRKFTEQSQAPMISVTHFMGRDGNFLAELSPRRYFCLQCHVPQVPTEPAVRNRFVDVDELLYSTPAASAPTPSPRRSRP
jgi:nitrate reductase (cytochrome), electron transfer subunit